MRRIGLLAVLAAVSVSVAWAPGVAAHPERAAFYPNFDRAAQSFGPAFGFVPGARPIFAKKGGKRLVVCKPDSKKRIKRMKGSLKSPRKAKRYRKLNLRLLKQCKFRHIQSAVAKAKSGYRIAILPGVYREEPSRKSPNPDPKCAGLFQRVGVNENQTIQRGAYLETETVIGSYEYHRKCPTSQNLIAITGDGPDADRKCDDKCNLQLVGTGLQPKHVKIEGQRSKLNVIKADRADGIHMRNFKVELSDFNNIYILETNGFAVDKISSGYSREYGILSFASDNGLYDRIDAYGSGDSGIYPGSGPEGHCQRYGIEIRRSKSHDNNIGYSGTAGNGVYAHDNEFFDNSSGMTVDSFAGNHPGMPQDCAKWENNKIYSNNLDLWNDGRDEYCNVNKRPLSKRDPKIVCPTFQNPVGTGILIAGGNGNIARGNHIYDNWRDGIKLFWVPRELRGEDPTGQSVNTPNQFDTSLDNKITGNFMGLRPDGARDPNGNDFWWDGEGKGNCWENNKTPPGEDVKSNTLLDACPGKTVIVPGTAVDLATQASCATWNPYDEALQDPPGCDWFVVPPEPK